jgi:UDP-galactopyranose mutase
MPSSLAPALNRSLTLMAMDEPPIAVVGGGLAGMAAAARLAKLGHAVDLYERAGVLGGSWAPYELTDGVLVDDAPAVLGFPAPWRDLFRKSGRPLEAELARSGHALVPADVPQVIFADGATLMLSSNRGEQHAALVRAYGAPAADRWRNLLDRLDEVWQALRPLGFESELPGRAHLSRQQRQRLMRRQTVADLAHSVRHPHLSALVRSVAYGFGASPEETPALVAVELTIRSTFGRWQIQPITAEAALDAGRSSVLVEALTGRLEQRKVRVRLRTPVTGIRVEAGRVTGIRTATAELPAAAVICTTDPWHAVDSLLAAELTKGTRRRLARLDAASAPSVRHLLVEERISTVRETTRLSGRGVPIISYERPAGERSIRTVHDFEKMTPRPSYGIAWSGFRSFVRRPAVTSEISGLFQAGPFSPAGAAPSAVVLSGALAAYGCQNYLYSDVRPLSKDRSS